MILFQPDLSRFDEMLLFSNENSLGFEILDLAFPSVMDNRNSVKKIIDLCSGKVKSVHGPFIDLNFSGGDPLVLSASMKRIEQCAGYTAELGAKRMVLHSCFFPIMPPDDPLYDIWAKKSAELMIGVAEKFGLEICVENVLDITPDIIIKMMKAADHPKIKACLDIGHANLSKCPVTQWIDELAPYISHVHLCDNDGIYDDHYALGAGSMDFAAINNCFERHAVKSDFTLEVKPFSAVVQSFEYIQNGGLPYVRQ